ncbi:GGDEF domain-containing protein [Spirulina sp. CS-785/01]|uniref:GGDEF domain-containing protein n=1 Tax=Spirulina sp. CS-785/01 TaxID=3021716 RepID=UPI00232CAC67|nr:GGDEF domain-containing protein [Spirulina sp. CS-785/01]MDB9312373.1 GGDEF domain-containing protein [Spirulina sp. CS-785/01]
MMQSSPGQPPSVPELLKQIDALNEQMAQLQQENSDLKILLETVTVHSDTMEEELHRLNEQLEQEMEKRLKNMRALHFLLWMVTQDIADLQIVLETATQHGDLMEQYLHDQSIRDPLTGLFNRRYLNDDFERVLVHGSNRKQPFGLILGDIDHFKAFNTKFGHKAGDEVLIRVCQYIQETVQDVGTAYRYGGEELLIIIRDCSLYTTYDIAQRLREGIKQLKVHYSEQDLGSITISFGVAGFPDHGKNSDRLIAMADEALYQAKAQGRDRVILAQFPPSS